MKPDACPHCHETFCACPPATVRPGSPAIWRAPLGWGRGGVAVPVTVEKVHATRVRVRVEGTTVRRWVSPLNLREAR